MLRRVLAKLATRHRLSNDDQEALLDAHADRVDVTPRAVVTKVLPARHRSSPSGVEGAALPGSSDGLVGELGAILGEVPLRRRVVATFP